MYHICGVKKKKSKRDFADKHRWRSAAVGFIHISEGGRYAVGNIKSTLKELLLFQNTAICDGIIFLIWKAGTGVTEYIS